MKKETHTAIKQQLIIAGKVLVAEGQDDFTRGHISVRVPGNPKLFFMKAHSLGLDEITMQNILTIDLEGNVVAGSARRHSEVYIHSEIFKARADVNCVIHTHPTYSVAFSGTGHPMKAYSQPGAMFSGEVGVYTDTITLIRSRSPAPAETLELRWPGTSSLIIRTLKQALLGGALGGVLGTSGCSFGEWGCLLTGTGCSAFRRWFDRGVMLTGAEFWGITGATAFSLACVISSLIRLRPPDVRPSPNFALFNSLRSVLTCQLGAALLSIPFFLAMLWFPEVDPLLGAVFTGGVLFAWIGLFIALEKGGYFLIDHFATRYLLRRRNLIPWDLVRFLDTAAERILLVKVGGSYTFPHRTFMEYFANTDESSRTVRDEVGLSTEIGLRF